MALPVPVDIEPVAPGEGEVAAAKRLLKRVLSNHPRLFDAVCADALYFEAPFIHFCLERGKDVLAVLKGEHRLLLQDAQGVFASMQPTRREERGREILLWDDEGFTSAEGVDRPLRVVHSRETPLPSARARPDAPKEIKRSDWWWVSTIPIQDLPARQLAQAGHARWDIENDLFNDLSAHWSLDHCFKHHPAAILHFVLTLFVTFIVLKSFHLRNVKDARVQTLPLIALADEFKISLGRQGAGKPWWGLTDLPPP